MWYTNLRLEESLSNNQTNTTYMSLFIEQGLIKDIKEGFVEGGVDMNGYLALPALKDHHIHLDKIHYGGPWQSVIDLNSVEERIKEEELFLNDFLETSKERAQALIDLVCSFGATYLKVHVNVDPIIQLQNLEKIYSVLEDNRYKLDYDLVVFPQHGFLKSVHLIEEALALPYVSTLGGVDPASLDGDAIQVLDTTFSLAKKYDKKIDIHLHDRGTLGLWQINEIIKRTQAHSFEGKVAISHAYCLGDFNEQDLKATLQSLSSLNITINTTVPLNTSKPPLPLLDKYNVKCNIINDNINDHWSPFGSGDLIERSSRGAEVFQRVDEFGLSQSLKYVTGGVTPLDKNGVRQWPVLNDEASILFTNASCSAELIARIKFDRKVMVKGTLINE
ncbi:hypothetical protein [Erysipelothrix urinaevulpis]|uniref:hypothetical protein n=1 Tax=Erysipelothrix urinaevulpis TaxID=2683717 RepID=UPI001914E06E|nr:hypothetical protein [Erysipelothrix urinaevulpis]